MRRRMIVTRRTNRSARNISRQRLSEPSNHLCETRTGNMRKKKEKAPPSKNKMKALINATKMTCSTTSKNKRKTKHRHTRENLLCWKSWRLPTTSHRKMSRNSKMKMMTRRTMVTASKTLVAMAMVTSISTSAEFLQSGYSFSSQRQQRKH